MRWTRVAGACGLALFWAAALAFHVGTLDIYNDHFDRIVRGRQIARYGELPFRDFLDPGYFFAEFSSAAALRLSGDRLIGEVLLNGIFIATGGLVVLVLAARISRSWLLGAAAATMAVLLMPRPYDYDKVLFYPLGLWLAWRYLERQRPQDAVLLAGGVAAAGLFRYDSAAYLGLTAVVALAGAHWPARRRLAARLALFAGAALLIVAPFLVFVQATAGLADASDQVLTYGVNEARPLQLVVVDPPPPADVAASSLGARLRRTVPLMRLRMPDHLYSSTAGAVVYFVMMALPLVAAVVAAGAWRRGGLSGADAARIWSLIVLALALNLFILRPPMAARIGGMAGPAAVLAAWLLRRAWDLRVVVAGAGWKGLSARAAVKLAVVVLLVVTVRSIAVAAAWPERARLETLGPARLKENLDALMTSPPDPRRLSAAAVAGVAEYLRTCTSPDDRILATWFAPELAFFAQRGFAGRMGATWHWTETRFQRRSIEALTPRTVVVAETAGYNSFRELYPLIGWHLERQFAIVGEADFGHPSSSGRRYRVLVHRSREASGTHAASGMPCFV